jgi:hypothetical protein
MEVMASNGTSTLVLVNGPGAAAQTSEGDLSGTSRSGTAQANPQQAVAPASAQAPAPASVPVPSAQNPEDGIIDQPVVPVNGTDPSHVNPQIPTSIEAPPNTAQQSSANLYCKINGEDHAVLKSLSSNICPSCRQDLRRPDQATLVNAVGDAKDDADPNSASQSEKKTKSSDIVYRVRYLNLDGSFLPQLASEHWPGSFSLKRDREILLRHQASQPEILTEEVPFQVDTVLSTGIRAWDSDVQYTHQEILGNPKLSVSLSSVQIICGSQPFIEALRDVANYDLGDELSSTPPVLRLSEPYAILGLHAEDLKRYSAQRQKQLAELEASLKANGESRLEISGTTPLADSNGAANIGPVNNPATAATRQRTVLTETVRHLKLGLQIISENLGSALARESGLHQQEPPSCTWRMLWYLLRPGSVVYLTEDEKKTAHVVSHVDMGTSCFTKPYQDLEPCIVALWHLEYNGRFLTRFLRNKKIEPFDGPRTLESLGIITAKMQDDTDGKKLRNALEQRGRSWVHHLQGLQVEYRGDPGKPGQKKVRNFLT